MHPIEKFWRKVKIGGPEECWTWLGGTGKGNGYGYHSFRGKSVRAHRIALFGFGTLLYESEIKACHVCDNKTCCNPSHLFMATDAGNHIDRGLKNRTAKGAAHGRSKLTEDDVRTIKLVLAQGTGTHREIADYLGVTCQQISAIKNGKSWNHVVV